MISKTTPKPISAKEEFEKLMSYLSTLFFLNSQGARSFGWNKSSLLLDGILELMQQELVLIMGKGDPVSPEDQAVVKFIRKVTKFVTTEQANPSLAEVL